MIVRNTGAGAPAPIFRSRAAWLLLFTLFFAACYALHGTRITPDPLSPERFHLLTGDEPHYLLVAHSLAFEGDIDLYDNRERGDYRAFYDRPVSGYVKTKHWLLERVSPRSSLREEPEDYWGRRALPTQPIGTSVLVAPAYRLGHAWGRRIRFVVALFFHALLAALALVMVEICWRLTGERWLSLLVAGGIALSAPLLYYSIPVFPDLPGALLIALGLLMLCRMQESGGADSPLRSLALGLCSAALPWVHLRFWPSALLLALAGAWPRPGGGRRAANLAAAAFPWAVSLAGLAGYYQLIFGTPWPASTAPPFSLRIALGSGWPGLLLDRDHGLLAYAPLAAFALPGIAGLLRFGGRAGATAAGLLLGYLGLVGANAGWNGGLSPPLRYWVPAMPLVAAAVAVALAHTPARGARRLALALGAVGPVIAAWGMLHPNLLYTYRHPLLSRGPLAGLWARLPVFFPEAGPGAFVLGGLAAAALALFSLWVLGRLPGISRPRR